MRRLAVVLCIALLMALVVAAPASAHHEGSCDEEPYPVNEQVCEVTHSIIPVDMALCIAVKLLREGDPRECLN